MAATELEEHKSIIMSPTIEKGSLVLITGVSGYSTSTLPSQTLKIRCTNFGIFTVASQTANQFLAAGYRVRGTVRSDEKAAWLYEVFDAEYGNGKFTHVVVKDMMAEGAFDEAVKGVDGVCHMANVMTFSDVYDEVVPVVVSASISF